MNLLDKLLADLPDGWTIKAIDVGQNWMLSQVQHASGEHRSGVAASPRQFPDQVTFPIGTHHPQDDARTIVNQIRSHDPTAAAVGLATLNAIQALDETNLSTVDATDWLSEQSKGCNIAIFGRFPFIQDEIRPFANDVFVFEQTPSDDEYTADDMPDILPQAHIIAITGTTIINHTIDDILPHTTDKQTVVVLGPSTPLTPRLFNFGIDALFGVRVADVDAVLASVHDHVGFQKVQGLQRVSLFRQET